MSLKVIASSVLISSLLISACSYFPFVSKRSPATAHEEKFQYFYSLLLEALEFRANALNFAKKVSLNEVSSPDMLRKDAEYAKETGANYLALRAKIDAIAMTQYENFSNQHEMMLSPGKRTRIEPVMFHTPQGQEAVRKYIHHIDPYDEEGQKKIFDIKMSLASALILFDNFMIGIQPYYNNTTFNNLLNYDTVDIKNREKLKEIASRYADVDIRVRVKRGIDFVDQVMEWRRKNDVRPSDAESKLYEIIQSSAWYLVARQGSSYKNLQDVWNNLLNRFSRNTVRNTRIVTFGLSMGFGNFLGLVETRKGYLYSMHPSEKAQLISEMKPLDIVLEKTPFRLTDKMIPGHYGHVAIWLGTENQLRELGVWNDIPEKYQKLIQAGHSMVEALRPGVQINTLDHFLNIDDLLVIRDRRKVSEDYRKKAVLKTIEQIGLEYDFNFDVDTHDRIVCSEIAYAIYGDVKWPKDKALGRFTISPDNVAKFAHGPSAIFEPVILYYNGKRYSRELTKSLELLLKESYPEFEKLHGIVR